MRPRTVCFGSHLQAGSSPPSLVNSANIQEMKEGLSEAEHEALQRALSVRNGERRKVFLSEGMYFYTPVHVHTHTHMTGDVVMHVELSAS